MFLLANPPTNVAEHFFFSELKLLGDGWAEGERVYLLCYVFVAVVAAAAASSSTISER